MYVKLSKLLKDYYNKNFLEKLSQEIKKHYQMLDEKAFINHCVQLPWDDLSLKERMKKISCAFNHYINGTFTYKVTILTKASVKFNGYTACVFPDFIEEFGLNHFTDSVKSLEKMTCYSTAEFAVRPFLEKYPNKMLKQMIKWSKHKNHHVRRLASEGCRPRLPWGKALVQFKQNPQPLLIILDKLKDDPSEYVRRSVANNLNDIGKDHPEILKSFVKANYKNVSLNCDKMLKHASRNLLKNSDTDILQIFSYPSIEHVKLLDFTMSETVDWGSNLEFSFMLKTQDNSLGTLRIEYEIAHLKNDGSHHKKVFKISESNFKSKSKTVLRRHSFKARSVRKYYPGLHHLSLKLNGKVLLRKSFHLLDPE